MIKLKLQIVKSLDYEIVRNDKYMEARVYSPRKRTIEISGRYYYLPFPQVLAAKVILEREPADYWRVVPEGLYEGGWYRQRSCSFLNFAFVNEGLVYPSYICQVDYVADKLGVCLVNDSYHAWWPSNANLTEMMRIFWTTPFFCDGSRHLYFESYHSWQKLNLKQVVEAISKNAIDKETLDAHLLKLENVCHKVSNAVKREEEHIIEFKRLEAIRIVERDRLMKEEKLRKVQVTKLLEKAWSQRKSRKIEMVEDEL